MTTTSYLPYPRLIQHYPAASWKEATLLGDGSLGAMLHGRIGTERITLNHERLWGGGIPKPLPDIHTHLPRLRALLDRGAYAEAETLYREVLQAKGFAGAAVAAFMPGADLEIATRCDDGFGGYRRELDLSTGIAAVRWQEEEREYLREAYVHSRRGVLCLTLGVPEPREAILRLAPHDLRDRFTQHLSLLDLTPKVEFHSFTEGLGITVDLGNDCRYATVFRLREMEVLAQNDGELQVRLGGRSRLEAVIAPSEGPGAASASELYERLCTEAGSPETLRKEHVVEHQRRMGAISFHLGSPATDRSNEALLEEAYSGALPEELVCRMFHYGRYLLVCSSQPGGLPAHLQGGWNGDYCPPWRSAFFNNENLQMSYWQALPGGIGETLLPVFDLYESRLPDFRQNARHLFGTRGILLPLYMSPECGLQKDLQSHVIYWTGAAAWLAQLYWEYWLFTRDRDFLQHRAIPFLREAALFYEDFLVETPEGGYLIFPGNSPENRALPHRTAVCINATLDVALIRELLGHLLQAHTLLKLEEPSLPRWQAILARLPEYEIAPTGALREWLHPEFGENDHHRHLSHIYPFFPGHEIPPDRDHPLFPAVAEAVRRRMTIGLGEQTGWSLVHLANIFGRLGNGEAARSTLTYLAQSCTGSTLLTYHNDHRGMGMTLPMTYGLGAPLQLDANFGYPAAVMEMLLYSSETALQLLPALPQAWRQGHIGGLHTRCGVIVEIEWDQDKRTYRCHLSARWNTCFTLRQPPAFAPWATPQQITLRSGEQQTLQVTAQETAEV